MRIKKTKYIRNKETRSTCACVQVFHLKRYYRPFIRPKMRNFDATSGNNIEKILVLIATARLNTLNFFLVF